MIYLIISDVHSNWESLQKFIELSQSIKHDKKVCLGDIVGYNADPNPCVEWIRDHVDIVLAGNHDYGVLKKIDISYFNLPARAACLWTRTALTKKNSEFLNSLTNAKEQDGITWVHASPFEPDEWHYVNNQYDAEANFPHFSTPCCFLGHSHKPVILELRPDSKIEPIFDSIYSLKADCRYIVNVGSLGQPRDGNPDPAFAIFDSEAHTVEIRRFSYDIALTQEKIKSQGLPSILAERLDAGY